MQNTQGIFIVLNTGSSFKQALNAQNTVLKQYLKRVMSNHLKLALTLSAKDAGAANALKNLETNIKNTASTTARIAEQSAATQVRAIRSIERTQQQSNAARARLGIRSEQQIQREIMRTQQAYQALASGGSASQAELQRAARASRERIRELNAELGKSSKFAGAMKFGKIGLGLAAGGIAAGMALKEPLQKRRDFDLNLAYAANTAYSDKDVKGRITAKKELYNTVKQTVLSQGGSRDQALEALNAMIASGTVNINTAKQLLPTIQKTSVASGTDSNDIAQIAISAMQQYHLTPEQIKLALDKAMAAGQAGQFELTDMAKWLPQSMAATANAGMGGMKDFDVLLRALQQSRVTAGSADEAGNNFVNLAAKITSADAVTKFKKAAYTDKAGKKHDGIDLTQSLLKRKANGENTLDAFVGIVDEYMSSNKQYQSLQKKINTSKNDSEKKQLLEQQATILGGTAVGDVLSDRQALMALLAIKNNKTMGTDVMNELKNADGTVNTAHAVIQDTNFAKKQNFDNTKDFGVMESLKGIDDTLSDVSQKLTTYSNQYPELGKMIGGTSVAFGALTAASVAASGALVLMSLGGKSGAGLLGKASGSVAKVGFGAGSIAKAAGGMLLKSAGKLGGAATVAVGGYNAYRIAHDQTLTKEEKKNAQIKNVGAAGGALGGMAAGAAAGAAIGSVVPLLGTVAGGIIGSIAGGLGGEFLGKKAAGLLTSNPAKAAAAVVPPPALAADKVQPAIAQQTADFNAVMQSNGTELAARLDRINGTLASQQQVIQNQISLILDGRIIAEQVSERQLNQFARG